MVRKLYEEIQKASFFSLNDEYTNLPFSWHSHSRITVQTKDQKKSIFFAYISGTVMTDPSVANKENTLVLRRLSNLQEDIIATTDVNRWVLGDH